MAVFCLSCPVYEECWHDNPGEDDETERVGGWLGGMLRWGIQLDKKNGYLQNKTRAVCLQIWVLALGVWFVFFVSLALFPQIQSDVKRLHFPIAGEALQQ